ncbi:MAG TPA: glycoside hydrolase [Fimbriimonas sp.]
MRTFTLHPDRTRQTIDNFGASDSWTVEPLIRWPEKDRQKIADLLFDPKKGIALSAWRFNLGGGINHETINNPLRTVDTFEVSEGVYDWNRVPGQRWMLKAAKEAGVPNIVAYSITPPRRLTRNGFTNGTDGEGTTNLKPGAEPAFARYLVDIVGHFQKQGYPVTHLSPINEPDFEWNGVPKASSQEGSRASNADILALCRTIRKEQNAHGMSLRLVAPEATSVQIGTSLNQGMERKYGAPYGDYVPLFEREAEWRREVDPIYAYHAYWSDNFGQIVPLRKKLREALNRVPEMPVWQTEYCQMAGPRGEGGWGRDLGMTLALNVARLIHFDLTLVEARAWQWWLAVSDSDYKDGLVYVDDLSRPSGTIYPSKTLWALGHFSRYVRPGFQRIEVDGWTEDPAGLLVSAYRDPKSRRIVVVLVNTETHSEPARINLDGRWTVQPYITSDRPRHDLLALPKADLGEPLLIPSRSVMTLVCDPVR